MKTTLDRWADSIQAHAADDRTVVAANDETWTREQSKAEEAFDRYLAVAHDPWLVEALVAECHGFQAELRDMIRVHRHLGQSNAWDWPRVGETFGGIALLGEIGRGGLSRVFLGSQPDLGARFVVLKVTPTSKDEAAILGPLNHPNIVTIHSPVHDAERGLSGICMPFEAGATLADVVDLVQDPSQRRGEVVLAAANLCSESQWKSESDSLSANADQALSGEYPRAVAHLIAQVASALAYTHQRGVVHNDIKPSNILLTPDGVPKLMDFNLSSDPRVEELRAGGTLAYMAPERIDALFLGDSASSMPQSADIYSLGVVLYELLCGRNPLKQENSEVVAPEELAASIRKRQASAFRFREAAWRETPKALQDIVRRCLAEKATDRPASARGLQSELELALLERRRPWSRLRNASAALAVMLFAACLIGGGEPEIPPLATHTAPFKMGLSLCRSRDYARAAEQFEAAHLIEKTNESLAWRLYALLRSGQPRKAFTLFAELERKGYTGEELNFNFAVFCSFERGVDDNIVDTQLDEIVARRPESVVARVVRAWFCVRRNRNTPNSRGFGREDMDIALRLAGDDADLTLYFLAARAHGRALRNEYELMAPEDQKRASERLHQLVIRCSELGMKPSRMLTIAGSSDSPVMNLPWYFPQVEAMKGNQNSPASPRTWMYLRPSPPKKNG